MASFIEKSSGDTATRSWIDRRHFRGRIDEVMIFDHALADQEIADLHASGRP